MTAPTLTLPTGAQIPILGLGTFGSDKYTPDQVAAAVQEAIQIGYRHIDCAAVYGNQKQIAKAIKSANREHLWITGKLWNDRHSDPEAACEQDLKELGIDYFDLYLIHWPFPNYHAPGVGVDSRDPHAKPFDHNAYMQTWRGVENLVKQGKAKHIGTSNMTVPKLKQLLQEAEIQPIANQLELHPHFQQPDLVNYLQAQNIVPIAYSPLGSPSRPERDRTPQDTVDTQDPVILKIAKDSGLTPQEVCIKWAIARGAIPIPFSVKTHQLESNLKAATTAPLTPQEMAALSKIDRNCRLIKGQVFLWPGAKDWHDLWDEAPT
jgi:diketogulonate reductase-like aldo/keto reductase